MKGKPVAYCVNNVWTEAAPECIPIKKRLHHTNQPSGQDTLIHYSRKHDQHEEISKLDKQRQLFNWGDQTTTQSVYGDGPRRLPLINGIWPPQDVAEQVLALGPQSTPGPKTMVKEEIDIAELRHKQLEELKRQRHSDSRLGGKRRQGHKKNKHRRKNVAVIDESVPRETIVSLGSTEDGDALSIAFAKPGNETSKAQVRHKYRHRNRSKGKHHGKGKKWRPPHPTSDPFITSRRSRVDTSGISPYHTIYQFNSAKYHDIEELRRRPIERVQQHQSETAAFEKYDASCVDALYGREVPMIAPQVHNAFVYRYETKKNQLYPFNSYMVVKYRCFGGFTLVNKMAHALYCKEGSWVGEIPRCVKDTA
ncbi:hypothetical protein X975_25821, partial [Stegodyphus mimosarum]